MELLRSYVEGLRHLSGALSVTLYVPEPLGGDSRSLLLHTGAAPPLPELADLDTARGWTENRLRDREGSAAWPCPHVLDSAAPDGKLVCLTDYPAGEEPSPSTAGAAGQAAIGRHRRRRADGRTAEDWLPSAWLGLRFSSEESLLRFAGGTDDSSTWWRWLLTFGGSLATQVGRQGVVLADPATGLPDRVGFMASVASELHKADQLKRPLAVLLINPDDFDAVNERFGREVGDTVVEDISRRLRTAIRHTDPLARYGGVIFGCVLRNTTAEQAAVIARKTLERMVREPFLGGSARLGFSMGLAPFDPLTDDLPHPLDLVRRADGALNNAKRMGGEKVVVWQEDSDSKRAASWDRLNGIFTGYGTKDYRNMALLSDTIEIIAASPDIETLASSVVEKLHRALKPDRIGLFSRSEKGDLDLIRGLTKRPAGSGSLASLGTLQLGARETKLLEQTTDEGRARIASLPSRREGSEERLKRNCYGLPLMVDERALGCLYLEGRMDSVTLQESDLIFLEALASQLGVAFDRIRLFELEERRLQQEKTDLQEELNTLRQALHQAKLVYRSAAMDEVLATARRVAPIDATVLITGESGTGKELLARTLHELSPRRGCSLVIVDCGAIASTLIESELFGHEKGAFTGAEQRRVGRLAEADRGTLFLDEVTELPLEVQSRLLRFVQEKQLMTVGGSKHLRVDVRVLAATNRDLAAEVATGRFREDLFHRLNVVRVEIPPLRERPDDIPHLARHFLESFAVQYQKRIRRLTPEAEVALLGHPWRGNVRELQNRMLQAVVMCAGEEIGVTELGFRTDRPGPEGEPPTSAATGALPPAARHPMTAVSEDRSRQELLNVLERLRVALATEISAAIEARAARPSPIGRWMSDDLVLEAQSAAGSMRGGAELAGMPETSFRRRFKRARDLAEAGLAERSETWSEVRGALADLIRVSSFDGIDLSTRAEQILFDEVVSQSVGNLRRGAALVGVTPRTFRRRLG